MFFYVCYVYCVSFFFFFFFFKQKTAYEMRISDWSSDVCSSDLDALDVGIEVGEEALRLGGVGGTPRTTGRRGRRVGGRVELGRIELVGRGIGSAPTTSHSPSASLIVELAGLFEQATGVVIAAAVHQRSSPGSVQPSNG